VNIRTLVVSLVAIAAIVASLAIARQRSEEHQPESPAPTPRTPAAVDLNLDAIRSAGF
jgi:methionine-rich copper-binding protein CopC